MTTRFQTTSY